MNGYLALASFWFVIWPICAWMFARHHYAGMVRQMQVQLDMLERALRGAQESIQRLLDQRSVGPRTRLNSPERRLHRSSVLSLRPGEKARRIEDRALQEAEKAKNARLNKG